MKAGNYIMLSALTVALIGVTGCSSDGGSSAGYVAQTPTAADSFEGSAGDDTLATASSISIDGLQNRTIYPASDVDWVAVELVAGTLYEFSVNNIEETADAHIELYDENGTYIDDSDDFVDYDSNLYDYNASYTGTHYLYPRVHGTPGEDLMSYQLGARVYVDADGDGYSPFYDCNDNNSSIEPWAMDIGGNGVDENCDGIDAIADTTADSYEDDDTLATAKPIPTTYGSMEEIQNRHDIQSKMRTIHEAGDVDYLKVTVAPYSGGEIIDVGMGSLYYDADQYSWEIQDENGSVLSDGTSNVWEWIDNTTGTTATYYLKVFAGDDTSTGGYMPAYVSYGEDRDGDGYYTKDSDDFDPDDNNISVP